MKSSAVKAACSAMECSAMETASNAPVSTDRVVHCRGSVIEAAERAGTMRPRIGVDAARVECTVSEAAMLQAAVPERRAIQAMMRECSAVGDVVAVMENHPSVVP